VNGKKVESVSLKEKDRIVIGEFVLEVGAGAPEAGAKPAGAERTSPSVPPPLPPRTPKGEK
jgi:hypothetical protein